MSSFVLLEIHFDVNIVYEGLTDNTIWQYMAVVVNTVLLFHDLFFVIRIGEECVQRSADDSFIVSTSSVM
jgi:hypothetical protein